MNIEAGKSTVENLTRADRTTLATGAYGMGN
jgi:hypothetical protein